MPASIVQFKQFFFDRIKVIKAMEQATHKAMSRASAFIARRAQTSMRYRKKASTPGAPPSAHRDGHGPLLRKFLWFGYDPRKQVSVIGPAKLPGWRAEAAPLNEFGGTAQRTTIVKQVTRKATPAQAMAYRKLLLSGRIITRKPPQKSVTARYPKRSFMGPALDQEIAKGRIPSQWSNSIRSQ